MYFLMFMALKLKLEVKGAVMKRDFELVRKLLLGVEEGNIDLSEFNQDQIRYHKALLIEAGLAEGPKPHYSSRGSSEIPDKVIIRKLTWKGHNFIDAIREERRWQKVKNWVMENGKVLTIGTIQQAIAALFT